MWWRWGKRTSLQNELAQTSLRQARYTTESQQVVLEIDVDQAQSELKSALEKLRLSDAQVQQARYAIQLANVRLKAGVVTPLEIQPAQTALEEAKFGCLSVRIPANAGPPRTEPAHGNEILAKDRGQS